MLGAQTITIIAITTLESSMGSAPKPQQDVQTSARPQIELPDAPTWITWPDLKKRFFRSPLNSQYWNENAAYLILFVIALGVAGWLFWKIMHGSATIVFGFLHGNLPLTLPILSLLLSLLLSPQDLTSVRGILRLSNPLSLGLLSFSLWYLVTAQTSPHYIRINQENVLNADYAVLVCLIAFIWAGFCSVVTAISEMGLRRRGVWMLTQVTLLLVSTALLFLPFGLLEKKTDVEKRSGVSLDTKIFTVVIPYRDPALNAHLGLIQNPIQQTVIYRRVVGRTIGEAKAAALELFRNSESNHQFSPANVKNHELAAKTVELLEYGIVAQEEVGQ